VNKLDKWRRLLNSTQPPRPAVFVSTSGKSKAEIVRNVVRELRRAGLLKETPRSRQIKC